MNEDCKTKMVTITLLLVSSCATPLTVTNRIPEQEMIGIKLP